MTVSARLLAFDGITELLRFSAVDPYWLIKLDLGFPDVREISTAVPGRDGEDDSTAHTGPSAITMELRIRDDLPTSRDLLLDQLRGFCHPKGRYWLHVTKDGWPAERRILVRGVQAPATFDRPGPLPISVGWKAPRGLWESTVLSSQVLFPTTGGTGGLTLPWTFPITFAGGTLPGSSTLHNGGTVDALPYFDIYGSCVDPILRLLDTGEQLAFSGLTVPDGQFVRVDFEQRVVLLNNDSGQSRYSQLDFTTLSWWALPPGDSQVAFVPTNPGAACQAVANWRDTMI